MKVRHDHPPALSTTGCCKKKLIREGLPQARVLSLLPHVIGMDPVLFHRSCSVRVSPSPNLRSVRLALFLIRGSLSRKLRSVRVALFLIRGSLSRKLRSVRLELRNVRLVRFLSRDSPPLKRFKK